MSIRVSRVNGDEGGNIKERVGEFKGGGERKEETVSQEAKLPISLKKRTVNDVFKNPRHKTVSFKLKFFKLVLKSVSCSYQKNTKITSAFAIKK